MLSIERIEITQAEFRRLALAAVLVPPLCTLAGVLAMLASMQAAPPPAAPDLGSVLRVDEAVPTLEFAAAVAPLPAAQPDPMLAFDAPSSIPSPLFAHTPTPKRRAVPANLPPQLTAGHFVVQAGVFTLETNARQCRESLRRRGVSSAVFAHAGPRGTSYHVVLGRYESWDAALRARAQLATELKMELFAKRLSSQSAMDQLAAI